MTLARLRFTYDADPNVMHLPHGLMRLRKAYEVYLGEALAAGEEPVRFDEARKHLREWARDK